MPKKISFEECQKRLNEKYPDEPVKLINYTKMSGPVTYECLICHNQHYLYKCSDLFMKKHLCNDCWYSVGKGTKTKEYQKQALDLIKNIDSLDFIEFGYNKKLLKSTIKIKCLKCGLVSELQLVYFLKKGTCPGCAYNAKHLTTAGVQNRLSDDYTLLEDYKGTDTKVLVRHESCGFIWKTTIHGLLSDYRCPKCSKKHSKGEQNIIKWLSKNNIKFYPEYKFDWSENRRYDFYLPDYNLVIEYMGVQHYKTIKFFQKTLEEQQEIDEWKKKKALLNGLQYFSISYLDYENIENILAQRLSCNESRDTIPETESTLRGEDIV